MGRRKKAGKHRTRTGPDKFTCTGLGGTAPCFTINPCAVCPIKNTGPDTGAGESTALVGSAAPSDQVTPELPVTDTSTAQLQAEADAAIMMAPEDLMAPGAVPAPAGPSQADIEAGYAVLTGAALDMAFDMAAPAWEVTNDEKGKLAAAVGKAATLWFPDGIPEKWIALIVVAGVGAQIVGNRRDPVTGKLKPRYFPPKEQAAPQS